jgi:DNA-binding response OmpR family regulator
MTSQKPEKTILVVEDETPLSDAIKSKFERMGVVVILTRTVAQAKESLLASPPDAVWLDHYLIGKEDGLDLIAFMRGEKTLKSIPVFVITNTGGYEKQTAYLRLGVMKYYIKSDVRLADVVGEIVAYLSGDQRQ